MTTDKKQTEAEKKPQEDGADKAAPADKGTNNKGADNKDADTKPAAAVNADTTQFRNEIEISCKKRLPKLDQGPVKAYSARPLKGAGGDNSLFAYVCEPEYVPRQRAAEKLSNIINPSLARLVGSGVVYWPPAKAQRMVFIYENNMGDLLMPDAKGGLGWKPERVIQTVIRPMISVLMDMRDRDLVHGNIRPNNMYLGGGQGSERVMLGDCLVTPPGYLQPVLFETVERAMTDPISRGQGWFDDDLYAFGVTLTVILRSRDPLEGLSEEDIMQQKLELGSYAALTGKERFTGGILELLRGLLYDDRAQRWGMDEVIAWEEGQRLSPKQSARKVKASRPIHFNDERYLRPLELAKDLHKNPSEAVQLIDSGALEQWITRSLEEKNVNARVEAAVETAQEQGRGPGYWDRLLSRVAMALDPDAPIRYAGMSFHPEGLPYSLAEAYAKKKELGPYADILNQGLVLAWVHNQTDIRVDVGAIISRYDSCRAFLRQNNIGYGMERCLYTLAPDARCQSEHLKNYYVLTPEDLMFAYEDLADKPNRPELFIDRHVAAMLSVKDRRMIDPYLQELNSGEYFKRVLANIKTLATIQKRSRMDAFPGITDWISKILDPVYKRFHDRELRQKLAAKIEKLREKGDISKILLLIDNPETIQNDFAEFRKAMKEYHELREEHAQLENKSKKKDYGRDTGREVAAIVSGMLAGILMLAFAFLYFTKGNVF